jgi:hypothetical protein
MKRFAFTLFLLLALTMASHAQRYKDPVLRQCAGMVQDDSSRAILNRLGTDFNISEWAHTLYRKCEATLDKKNPKYLLDIARAEQTARDLLYLSSRCEDNKAWRHIRPDLEQIVAVYEEVEVQEHVEESQAGGFEGLFEEEESEQVSFSLNKVRKLKNKYLSVSKKAKP